MGWGRKVESIFAGREKDEEEGSKRGRGHRRERGVKERREKREKDYVRRD